LRYQVPSTGGCWLALFCSFSSSRFGPILLVRGDGFIGTEGRQFIYLYSCVCFNCIVVRGCVACFYYLDSTSTVQVLSVLFFSLHLLGLFSDNAVLAGSFGSIPKLFLYLNSILYLSLVT
jgi:hypothetical protein